MLKSALIDCRKTAGLTQTQVAEKLEVPQSAVSQWECGDTRPDIYALLKLAVLYGCTVDELLGVGTVGIPRHKPGRERRVR